MFYVITAHLLLRVMRIYPFYSFYLGLAVEEVWHNNDECEIGNSVALADRRFGTDGRKHCMYCALHNRFKVRDASFTNRSHTPSLVTV